MLRILLLQMVVAYLVVVISPVVAVVVYVYIHCTCGRCANNSISHSNCSEAHPTWSESRNEITSHQRDHVTSTRSRHINEIESHQRDHVIHTFEPHFFWATPSFIRTKFLHFNSMVQILVYKTSFEQQSLVLCDSLDCSSDTTQQCLCCTMNSWHIWVCELITRNW